jgi:hypothetical protein
MFDPLPPVTYVVPTEGTSPRFGEWFSKGCRGKLLKTDVLMPGDVALFGSLARWQLLQQAQQEGRRWFYGDHAYFGRRRFFRITRNAYQHDAAGSADLTLLDQHGIRPQGWRRAGANVLLCPNSPAFMAAFGLDADAWVAETSAALRSHTDRPIVVRWKHDSGSLEGALDDAWAVVVYVSVCGVHAALAGVPCFATAPCASAAFGTRDLSLIERPVRPDNRAEMAAVLAANQWTEAQIRRGVAWEKLKA